MHALPTQLGLATISASEKELSMNGCRSCGYGKLDTTFRFCPNCGQALDATCAICNNILPDEAKFCPECGSSREPKSGSGRVTSKPRSERQAPDPPPPPSSGVTVQFPYSSSQTFDFAVKEASALPGYACYGSEKRALYRVTVPVDALETLLPLLEQLKGWRTRTVFVDGQKMPWDSVFGFTWCYEKRSVSFKPDRYCFGFEDEWQFNVWGCIQSQLLWNSGAKWFCYGKWQDSSGTWRFDKERMRHELQKNLFGFRFCPAIQPEFVEDVLRALPDAVNPTRDKNWKFVEQWGEEAGPSLVVSVKRWGSTEKVTMKGVAPNGNGALAELSKKLNMVLPSPGT